MTEPAIQTDLPLPWCGLIEARCDDLRQNIAA
jgi:hypothetical protein